jgi:hypothetical protein
MTTDNRDILEAALMGYEHQRNVIAGKIADLRSRLGSPAKAMVAPEEKSESGPRKKRKVSKEARKKMAEAQKRRWAAVKKAKAAK